MILVDSSVFIDFFNGVNNWQVNKLDEIESQIVSLVVSNDKKLKV